MSEHPKGQFPHYMLKEIYDQPQAMRAIINGCLDDSNQVVLPNFTISAKDIRRLSKITIAASGSSRHAGLVGEFMLERMTGLPVEVDFANQYCYRDPIVGPDELTLFISQSGTTIDTIAALHEGQRKGSLTLAICNVADSPLTQLADATLLTNAGEEIAVAATKSFTTQLTALFLLSAYIAHVRGNSQPAESVARDLRGLPDLMTRVLSTDAECHRHAKTFSKYKDFIYLGRDIDYPIALEGALKLKEISYIRAEGYPTGELKHGPRALIDEHLPIVAVATQDQGGVESVLRYGKTLSNLREFADRKIPVLTVVTEGDQLIPKISPFVVAVPPAPALLQPIVEVVPLQFLAYHMAVLGGHNVDHPRNLSKSVVIE